MNGDRVIQKVFTKTALVGAALAVLCGWLLLTPLGKAWENASYDLLFRFGARAGTDRIVLIRMDNDSYKNLNQTRGAHWDRKLHAELLHKLTADRARLVVFDVLFKNTNDPETDALLAGAMRQNGRVVLAAFVKDESDSTFDSFSLDPPQQLFLDAAAGCGVGKTDAPTGEVARRHWPFAAPGEGDTHSLGWVAARVLGTNLEAGVENQWLRYYGKSGPGKTLPYWRALSQSSGYFRDKIVFIGGWPEKPRDPGVPEDDKFRTPYTQPTGEGVGGVEIMATTFLNLVNGDWLRRLPAWTEILLLALSGIFIGGGLCRLQPLTALLAATGIFLFVMLGFVAWSYFSNVWFPWLTIAGGQLPCALAWAWVSHTQRVAFFFERFPGLITVGQKPFGKGSYGQVWVVRNVIGQLQALKEVERAKFDDAGPYEREFRGLENYAPVSGEHPGLLPIFFVNCNHLNFNDPKGYFYYVMALGDALDPDWQQNGQDYQPRDLTRVCSLAAGGRLPARECVRIGIALLEALDFLHRHDLVHRDIKPSNIIFVKGRPKLADVGLVREAPQDGQEATRVFTPGFEDPLGVGTKLADLFALAITLYVISTGQAAESFSKLPTACVEQPAFMRLNEIICKACQRAADQRYASAAAMLAALREAQREFDAGQTKRS